MGFSASAVFATLVVATCIILSIFSSGLSPLLSNTSTSLTNFRNRGLDQVQSEINITGVIDGVEGTWWNTSFGFRKDITIVDLTIPVPLAYFPFLVDITDADLQKHVQQANGNDIAIVDDTHTTQYSHQIELYENQTGHLVAWVKIPSLSGLSSNVFYIYYGNSTCASQQDPTGVWNSNFHGVWHLNESSGSLADSTSYWNNGSEAGTGGVSYNVDGQIAGAMDFPGSTSGGYLWVGDPADGSLDFGTGSFTVEAWVNTDEDEHRNIVSKYDASLAFSYGYDLRINNGVVRAYLVEDDEMGGTNQYTIDGSILINDSNWHHVAVVFDRPMEECRIYVDGELDPNTPGWIGFTLGDTDTDNGFKLAQGPGQTREFFDGAVDEVRVSNYTRSITWINVSYLNQRSPSDYCSLGDQTTIYLTVTVENLGSINLDIDKFNLLVNGTIYECTCNRSSLFPLNEVQLFSTTQISNGEKQVKVVADTGVDSYYDYTG